MAINKKGFLKAIKSRIEKKPIQQRPKLNPLQRSIPTPKPQTGGTGIRVSDKPNNDTVKVSTKPNNDTVKVSTKPNNDTVKVSTGRPLPIKIKVNPNPAVGNISYVGSEAETNRQKKESADRARKKFNGLNVVEFKK
jgi:hypothetical protein